MSLICLFVTFTCPLVWGWYDVDNLWVIEYLCIRASKALLQKWDPLSVGSLRMTCKNWRNPWIKWASRTHFVWPFRRFCGDQSVHRTQVHGRKSIHSYVLPLVYTVWWFGQDSIWKSKALPKRRIVHGRRSDIYLASSIQRVLVLW